MEDRRVQRTRTAVIEAFNHLVLRGPRGRIRVADIIEKANVGRSTFYDHYSSAEEVHLEALSRPFAYLADAAAGQGNLAHLTHLLHHFWENRHRARETFDGGRMQERTGRLFADLIEQRLRASEAELTIPHRLAAIQLAEAALAPIRAWIRGAAPCAPEVLAQGIYDGNAQLAAALRKDTQP